MWRHREPPPAVRLIMVIWRWLLAGAAILLTALVLLYAWANWPIAGTQSGNFPPEFTNSLNRGKEIVFETMVSPESQVCFIHEYTYLPAFFAERGISFEGNLSSAEMEGVVAVIPPSGEVEFLAVGGTEYLGLSAVATTYPGGCASARGMVWKPAGTGSIEGITFPIYKQSSGVSLQ